MAFEFRLPDIGEGVVEGEVVKWKVAEGETIKLDQPMVEIMTDKATVEIPAPRAGKVARIMVAEGKICAVGEVLIVIDDGSAAAVKTAPVVPPAAQAVGPAPATSSSHLNGGGNGKGAYSGGTAHGQPAGPMHMSTQMAAHVPEPIEIPAATEPVALRPAAGEGGRVLATPATRKIARELGVDLKQVPPTGKNGRVTSDDVKSFRPAAPPAPLSAPAATPAPPREPVAIPRTQLEERVPFRGVRKAIAANMVKSKFTATHFTYVEEVDMTDLVALRGRTKDKAAERGVKLTYLPFIAKAAVSALKKWPSLNASLDEASQEIVYKKYYHLGIATQGPQGLTVAVIRDADKRSIFDLAKEIERLSTAIRDGKATREDLTGSTFTISSLGQLGGVLATPIINFPESGIMGVHKIAEKPAVRDGQIVIRQLMNLSISVDHRIADGYDGAMLLQEVKSLLEDPPLMFMEMI
ncbi:MAG TPA: dihydrolipoamide acetyltransferase family protein [Dongiaceae bacterium]|nr:dihydrolipoamide acetyltransferase family protein [Dongiaceae bacterium]